VLCAASFLAVVDTTIVTIALPSIRAELGLSLIGAQWVLTAYALVFGGLLLLSGRLADRYGRRRAFVVGLLVFAIGSVLAGTAPWPWVLIAGRVVQGLGAAAFVPASLSLLTTTFRDRAGRSRALGAYGAMAGLGFVAGMVGGGVLTELSGWRWIFLVNLPIVAVTLLPVRCVPADRPDERRPLDAAGAVAVTAGLALLVVALAAAPAHGWAAPRTYGPGLLGLAALGIVAAIERRQPSPLLPPRLVGRRAVLAPNGAVALQSMVGVAWLFLLTLYFQDLRGHGPLATGLLFAPMTAASLAGAWLGGRLAATLGPRRTATAGLVLVGAGVAAMGLAVAPAALPAVVAGMVVGEAGFMLGSVALTVLATGGLPDRDSGLAAGLLNTATQLGGGIGLGVVATVVATAAPAEVTGPALRAGFVACLAFTGLGLLVLRSIREPS